MTLDDQLRAALHRRANALPPSPDPLAGVERRARGLRRRRLAASVAGSALAVLAVVGAVPLLTPDRTSGPAPGELATSAPSPSAAPSRYALDPADPWDYRGTELPQRERDALLAEWQAVHPSGTLTPLFGQVWEPSQQLEVLFLDARSGLYGYAQGSEGGWRFRELSLPEEPVTSLAITLGGDEALRAVVVAAPDAGRVDYAPDGSRFSEAAALADGVATFAVEQAPGTFDLYQVVRPDGEIVAQGPVSDEVAPSSTPEDGGRAAPANLVGWQGRGTLPTSLLETARQAYAQSRSAAPADVEQDVLFAGDDAGRRYLLGQFWLPGDQVADTVGVVVRPDQEDPELQLFRPAARNTDVLALHLSPVDGRPGGTLVVVPRPGTGQVLYSRTGRDRDEFAYDGGPARGGVVVLSRDEAAERGTAQDRLRLLDGEGAEMGTYRVADLLCGPTSCG